MTDAGQDTSREQTQNEPLLRSCPFCGHLPQDWRDFLHPTGQGWRDDDGLRHYMRQNDPRGVHGLTWELNCLDHEGGCGASMRGDSREEVLDKWNRRDGVSLNGSARDS